MKRKSSKNWMRGSLRPWYALVLFLVVAVVLVVVYLAQPKQVTKSSTFSTQPLSQITVRQSLHESSAYQSAPVVDLSGWQLPKAINYETLADHISGAIIRVQTGASGQAADASQLSGGEDKQFKIHMTQLQKQGIPVAVYAYVTGKTNAQMKEQAEAFYKRAAAYRPTYYFLDVEDYTMPIGYMNEGISVYVNELKSLGVTKIGLYSTVSFLNANQISTSPFTAFWLADYGANTGQWNSSPQTTLDYQLQQYTNVGKIAGYSGELDLSRVTSEAAYKQIFLSD